VWAAAKAVVGQANFTTNLSATTNRGFNTPNLQPFVDTAGSLWIPDYLNNRVLRFPADVTKPLLVVTPAIAATTTKAKITIKGTASDAFGIAKVQYKIGNGALKTAVSTNNNTKWQFNVNLATGANTITIFAVDSVGNASLNKVLKIKRKSSAPSFSLAAIE